eukprot:7625996-Prorocentrum_lima.AAC.1
MPANSDWKIPMTPPYAASTKDWTSAPSPLAGSASTAAAAASQQGGRGTGPMGRASGRAGPREI